MVLALQTPPPAPGTGNLGRQAGTRIRKYRKARDMTLAELAAKCGTTPQTIQRLESAKITLSPSWVELISAALDIEPYQLFGDGAVARANDAALHAQLELESLRAAFKRFCAVIEESCGGQL